MTDTSPTDALKEVYERQVQNNAQPPVMITTSPLSNPHIPLSGPKIVLSDRRTHKISVYAHLSYTLYTTRKNRSMSAYHAGQLAGCSATTIRRIEKGETTNMSAYIDYAWALGFTISLS